ncbi:MAG: biopolymer transporter ExbD [Deltaproteobacteria bacterium]|nr:biopolymer transporter ExbD [Deltaproteobacteria bacterium]
MADDRDEKVGDGTTENMSAADLLVQMRREAKAAAVKAERRKVEPFQFGFTSLLDALVVLLMFLLVTISADPLNVKMDERLLLARSTSDFEPKDAIPILIKKGFIAVDDKEVVRVDCKMQGGVCSDADVQNRTKCDQNPKQCTADERNRLKTMSFFVDKSYKEDADENSFLIVPLQKALEELVKSEQEENRELKREFKGLVNIIADRAIPFRLIAEVVHTAGTAQLSNMRFAIIKVSNR